MHELLQLKRDILPQVIAENLIELDIFLSGERLLQRTEEEGFQDLYR